MGKCEQALGPGRVCLPCLGPLLFISLFKYNFHKPKDGQDKHKHKQKTYPESWEGVNKGAGRGVNVSPSTGFNAPGQSLTLLFHLLPKVGSGFDAC